MECCSNKEEKSNLFWFITRIILSIVFLILGIVIKTNRLLTLIFYLISYLIIGIDVLYKALKNILNKEFFDETFLMSLATIIALVVYIVNPSSGIDANDAILVMLLYQIGEFLQDLAVDKSKESIYKMMDSDNQNLTILEANKEKEIPLEEVKVGNIIKVKPGDKIVIDGIVSQGKSNLNTASITGESKPYYVEEGDLVYAGSINLDGLFYLKATATYDNSTPNKVKKLIEEASENKAKSESFITKFAKIYTPIVILISLVVMFIPPLILGFSSHFYTWLYRGLAIMVISCPCALVISVPCAYFLGIGKCAKEGILIKGSNHLENLTKLDIIAFDKTGTLTKGEFKVIEDNLKNDLARELLYALEKSSTHPIALDLVKKYQGKVKEIEISDVVNVAGYGLKAKYEGKEVLVGNYQLMEDNGLKIEKIDKNATIIYVAYDQESLGYLTMGDSLKDNVENELAILSNNYQLCLISGDNENNVKEIAKELNIENYYAKKNPLEKAKIINSLKENNKVVAYIGDGINDAATIANADVGFSFNTKGADISKSAADIVLMNDNIGQIRESIKISKKTARVVKMNIIFAITIKVLIMVLELVFKLEMFWAIIADVGVCLLTILNATRIK